MADRLKRVVEASKQSLGRDDQVRLGKALARIGRALASESTILERFVGSGLATYGAELAGSTAEVAALKARAAEYRRWFKAYGEASVGNWPLPGLLDEVAPLQISGEAELMSRVAGPASSP